MRISQKFSQGIKKKRRVIPIQSRDCNRLNSNTSTELENEANYFQNIIDNKYEQDIQQQKQAKTIVPPETNSKWELDTKITVSREGKLSAKNSNKLAMLSELQEQIKKARSCEQKFNNYKELIQKYEEYRMKTNMIENDKINRIQKKKGNMIGIKQNNSVGLNHYSSQQQIISYYPSIEQMLYQQRLAHKKKAYVNNTINHNINNNYNSLSSKTLLVNNKKLNRQPEIKIHSNFNNTQYNHQKDKSQIMMYLHNQSKMQRKLIETKESQRNQIQNQSQLNQIQNQWNQIQNQNEELDEDHQTSKVSNQQNSNQKSLSLKDEQNSLKERDEQHGNKGNSDSRKKEDSNKQFSNGKHQDKNELQEIISNSKLGAEESGKKDKRKVKQEEQRYKKQLEQKYLSLNETYNKHLKQTKQLNDKFDREKEHLLRIKTQHFQNQQLIDELMYMVRNRDYQLLERRDMPRCQQNVMNRQNIQVQTQLSQEICERDNEIINAPKGNTNNTFQASNYNSLINNSILYNASYHVLQKQPGRRQSLPNTLKQQLQQSSFIQNTKEMTSLKKDQLNVEKVLINDKTNSIKIGEMLTEKGKIDDNAFIKKELYLVDHKPSTLASKYRFKPSI